MEFDDDDDDDDDDNNDDDDNDSYKISQTEASWKQDIA
jgi:hypothetical protein